MANGPPQRRFCEEPRGNDSEVVREWGTYLVSDRRRRLSLSLKKNGDPAAKVRIGVEVFAFLDGLAQDLRQRSGTDQHRKYLESVRKAVDLYNIDAQNGTRRTPRTAVLTQVFEGSVMSVTDRVVSVEFQVDDDLEVRQFPVGELNLLHPLAKGDAVQARCQLEIIPPTEPHTKRQVEDWKKKEYKDAGGYQKKTKRGASLVEEEDE